ncbi:unnamed protein product [Camellia sinensis]
MAFELKQKGKFVLLNLGSVLAGKGREDMDLWIAVAAAGAGYVTKCWKKNRSMDRESSSEFSSGDSKFVKPESPPSMGHLCDKSCSFQRLAPRKILGEDVFTETEQAAHSASAPEMALTSGFDCEKLVHSDNHKDCNALSISSLCPPVYLQNEHLQVVTEGLTVKGNVGENVGDLFREPSMKEMGIAYGLAKKRRSLSSRQSNRQFVKPLTSLESCLMAQLYKEHARMEEYVLNSVPLLSSPTVKPFFVTDGKKIIHKGGDNSFNLQIETEKNKPHKEICLAEHETVFGVPPLPHVGSLELPNVKLKKGKELGGKLSSSSKMVNGKSLHSLAGSSHGAFLFGLGLSVGVLSSLLANKREVEKLNDLLKQTENLVQDLQDELEMKDSLTVKELAIEDYESQDAYCRSYNKRAPHSFSSEQNLDGSTKSDSKELPDQKAEEDSESMSKIEAELEAELERLELNMNSSSLEGRLSDLVELDPDFVPDITQGELRSDIFASQAGAQPYADQDGSGTSTPHSANYAVSPRQLTLCLHEVIQSRLEDRVKELETALENSQRKVHFMESERKIFCRDFLDSEFRSSSYRGSPIVMEELNAIDQSVVIDLSREALYSYNEAHDEFMKINELEEGDLTSEGQKNHQKALPVFDQNGKASPALNNREVRTLDEHVSSGNGGFSRDESENGHDETEKLLIKKIVEKTRKGSSVILSAEKRLFSEDE